MEQERTAQSLTEEIKRKAIHLSMIVIPLWIYFVPGRARSLGLIIATLVTVALDLLRLSDARLKRFFLRFFRSLIRVHEEEHLLGSTYFMIAALFSLLLFDSTVAVAALAFLVLGDTAAAVVGKRYGKPRYWGKSLEGSLACTVSCVLVGMVLFREPLVIVVGAAAATIAEAVPLPMDDNMRIPIFSGIAMQMVYLAVS